MARAIPAGSARHLSYLFAAPRMRAPLLGTYALLAEWLALLDPATERAVAQVKLAWWQEEMLRLGQGSAVHPVSRFLAAQPGAAVSHFALLADTLDAAMLELGGVPLERAADLEVHSGSLFANPLRVASLIAAMPGGDLALERCTQSLALGQYLARALLEYRRFARDGRVCFAVEELLQAGIETSDLLEAEAPARLREYLGALRRRAEGAFAEATQMPADARADLRHLLVLAALGLRHLHTPAGGSAMTRLKDMLLAWTTARRAAN